MPNYNLPNFVPLNIFSNKSLPEVYDDSMSYFEHVAKLMAKINSVGEEMNNIISILNGLEFDGTDILIDGGTF